MITAKICALRFLCSLYWERDWFFYPIWLNAKGEKILSVRLMSALQSFVGQVNDTTCITAWFSYSFWSNSHKHVQWFGYFIVQDNAFSSCNMIYLMITVQTSCCNLLALAHFFWVVKLDMLCCRSLSGESRCLGSIWNVRFPTKLKDLLRALAFKISHYLYVQGSLPQEPPRRFFGKKKKKHPKLRTGSVSAVLNHRIAISRLSRRIAFFVCRRSGFIRPVCPSVT